MPSPPPPPPSSGFATATTSVTAAGSFGGQRANFGLRLGAYLLDSGRVLILWLGRAVRPDFMAAVFGVDPSRPPPDALSLSPEPPRPGSDLSARVCAVLDALRATRPNAPPLFVVQAGTPSEAHVAPFFVEDRTAAGPSYAEFAAGLQKTALAKT